MGRNMKKTDAMVMLGEKEITPDDLADEVLENLDLLPKIYEGISSSNSNIKFGCAKILRTVSIEKPEEIYPKFDFFIDLLDSSNNIIKWNAIDVVANLSKVDDKERIEDNFEK